MKFVNLKSPLLAYSDKNIYGTFVKMSEDGAESGYVYVWFKPLGEFTTKMIPNPIRKEHIYELSASDTDKPGVESRVVFIFTGEEGSLVNNILNTAQNQTIKNLRETIKSLRMQLSTQKQISEEASSGAESYVNKMENLKSGGRRRAPFGEEGRFGYDNEFDF